jgi:hypothetical protein
VKFRDGRAAVSARSELSEARKVCFPLSAVGGWEGTLRQGASQKTCLWPVGIRDVLAIWNFDAAAQVRRPAVSSAIMGAGRAVLHMTTKPSFLSRERRLFYLSVFGSW